jgi:hypothetical protein
MRTVARALVGEDREHAVLAEKSIRCRGVHGAYSSVVGRFVTPSAVGSGTHQ